MEHNNNVDVHNLHPCTHPLYTWHFYYWVSAKNDTSNNGTSGKVGKNSTFSILGLGVGLGV